MVPEGYYLGLSRDEPFAATAEAEKWLEGHGVPGVTYYTVQVRSKDMHVEEVTQRKLVFGPVVEEVKFREVSEAKEA